MGKKGEILPLFVADDRIFCCQTADLAWFLLIDDPAMLTSC